MNKLGIKLYGNNIYKTDGIDYFINSIKHQIYTSKYKYKFRVINCEYFGIKLRIKKFR